MCSQLHAHNFIALLLDKQNSIKYSFIFVYWLYRNLSTHTHVRKSSLIWSVCMSKVTATWFMIKAPNFSCSQLWKLSKIVFFRAHHRDDGANRKCFLRVDSLLPFINQWWIILADKWLTLISWQRVQCSRRRHLIIAWRFRPTVYRRRQTTATFLRWWRNWDDILHCIQRHLQSFFHPRVFCTLRNYLES